MEKQIGGAVTAFGRRRRQAAVREVLEISGFDAMLNDRPGRSEGVAAPPG